MPTFTNQATLTYYGSVINSNVVTGTLLEALSATKTAVSPTYTQGDTVTYVISIVNSSATAFTNLEVSDLLGAYTYGGQTLVPMDYVDGSVQLYINGSLQTPAPPVITGSPVVFGPITLPANSNALLVYETRINLYASPQPDSTITNNATITADGLVNPVPVSETITAVEDTRLTIAKAMCPATVTDNAQMTYTFVIQNTGSAPADEAFAVSVTDTLDPKLTGLVVTYNGTTWTEGTQYTYNESTGAFATSPGIITVEAAGYRQNTDGVWTVQPGVSVLTLTGTV